jgi:uncharacterized protein YjiS (DUF1127 family)
VRNSTELNRLTGLKEPALATNGFGDSTNADAVSSTRLANYQLHRAARAHRSFTLGEIIVAAVQAAGAIVRQAQARHRQRQRAKATYDALQELDDHMLRDLGFDRSELRSVAAEATGDAERTRVRAFFTLDLPRY